MKKLKEYKAACDVIQETDGAYCRVQLTAPDGRSCTFMIPFDAKTMTRWPDDFDEEANGEALNIVNGPKAEAFARALNEMGWMIVRQCYDPIEGASRWPLDSKYGPVPTGWAEDFGTPKQKQKQKPAWHVIDGGRLH